MEVVHTTPTMYQSLPSSPKGFGNYYVSAPASPSRMSQLYTEFEYFSSTTSFEVATNKIIDDGESNNQCSFAFYVNRECDKLSRSAEELFHGGKIKPLNESRSSSSKENPLVGEEKRGRERERERERGFSTMMSSSSNSGRRVTRSYSPYRKSWGAEKQELEQTQAQSNKEKSSTMLSCSPCSCSKGSKKWSLKDFLLFRSASEGRGSSKDALKKYHKKNINEVKGSSSFGSLDSSRRKGQVSVHEFHYAMKRAESKDMKKRTFLPYKQGILGRLAGFGL